MVTHPHRLHFNTLIELSTRIRKDLFVDRNHSGALGTDPGCGYVGGLPIKRVIRGRQDLREIRGGSVRRPPANNLEPRVEDGQDAIGVQLRHVESRRCIVYFPGEHEKQDEVGEGSYRWENRILNRRIFMAMRIWHLPVTEPVSMVNRMSFEIRTRVCRNPVSFWAS